MGQQLFNPNSTADGNRTVNGRVERGEQKASYVPSNPKWRNQALYSLLNPLTTTNLQPIEFRSVGPLSRWLGNVSIRWVITVPFIVQMVLAVAVVGYLSFRHGQSTAGILLEQLQTEMGDRVCQQLNEYLKAPRNMAQLNQRAYELGFWDGQDLDRMQQYFYQQMVLSNAASEVNFAHVDGRFVGVSRNEDGLLYGMQITPQIAPQATPQTTSTTTGQLQQYGLDGEGNRTQLLNTSPDTQDYDPRTSPWYTAAVEAGEPIWTDVYQWPEQPDIYAISASYPIYQDPDDPNTLVGVLGVDFILSQMNQFLADSMADSTGQIFIVERSTGLLVASSASTPAFTQVNGESVQIRAIASENPLIRETATYLEEDLDGFNFTTTPQSIQAQIGGDRHYLRLTPWRDPQGLDWLVVAVTPKSATIAQISRNTVITLVLCGVALAIAIAISIRSAQWIIQPILFLNKAAKNLAGGAWNQTFVLQRTDEVGELAQSFNDMARQLRHSFRDLEKQKDSFARFFPPEYLDVLDKPNIYNIRLGDHVSREMAVMFSDIRGFTSLSEAMTPQETFSFVNDYLAEVAPAIRMHEGLIIKFLGDGTMAVFPHSADSAVNAGIDTFHALNFYNRRRISRGGRPIHIGIGMHVGYMMMGIIGEQNRMQADVISDTVNLTARLEGLTKFYGVSFLISGQVVADLSDPSHYQLRFLGEAVVKGRREPISIYEVVDVDGEGDRLLKQQTLEYFNAGIQAYSEGNLNAAKAAFEQVIAIHPQDQPAHRFLDRITEYLTTGIPDNWTGVWRFTSK